MKKEINDFLAIFQKKKKKMVIKWTNVGVGYKVIIDRIFRKIGP